MLHVELQSNCITKKGNFRKSNRRTRSATHSSK